MVIQIFIGSIIIFLTIVLQVVFISSAMEAIIKAESWFIKPPHIVRNTIVLVAMVLWLVAGISLSAWLWAGVLFTVGAFDSLEPALYFAIVTFTTLGYGDFTLEVQWRILASFAAVDGLIIFGLNTAFLVEVANRLRRSQNSGMAANEKITNNDDIP